jgi:SNF2 family DNA or RNA helicase
MGTGKTIQVAGLLNIRGSEYRRILLVTPASMKIIWARELAKWLVRKETSIMVIKGRTKEEDLPKQGIWIVNYELLQKFRLSLIRDSWDLLVLDEAHYQIPQIPAHQDGPPVVRLRKAKDSSDRHSIA